MLTYNRQQFVGRMIECILAQTFRDFEFIIVDNGSTDDSGKIADEYAKEDSRIRVIHREKGTIGTGRNTGLDASSGEYIAFVDDDDTCTPDYIQFLYDLITENDADIAICGADKIEDGKKISLPIYDRLEMDARDAIIELLWRKRFNNGFPTKLIHKTCFRDIRFPVEGLYDDIHIMYRVLARARRIVFDGKPHYTAVRHGGNNSIATTRDGMITPEYLRDYRVAYQKRTEWLKKQYPANSKLWDYFEWSFLVSMTHKIVENHLTKCDAQRKEMVHVLKKHKLEFNECEWAGEMEKEWMEHYVKV